MPDLLGSTGVGRSKCWLFHEWREEHRQHGVGREGIAVLLGIDSLTYVTLITSKCLRCGKYRQRTYHGWLNA